MQETQAIRSQNGGQVSPVRHKQPGPKITAGGIAKTGAVILGTTGAYYLAKATGVFSYFGWGSSGDGSQSSAKSNQGIASDFGNNPAVWANGLKIIDHSSKPTGSQDGLRGESQGPAMPFEGLDVAEIEHRFIGGRSLLEVEDVEKIARHYATNPTFVGSYDTPDSARGVTVSGNYAYVADGYSGLQIIDIGNPESPTLKGSYNTPGWAWGVTVSGNYAYVADRNSGLQIIDISNPESPTFKGSYNTPGGALGVTLSGNYAYLAYYSPNYASGFSGLQIIDISDVTNPTFTGSYDTRGKAWEVTVSGNYAYVADDFAGGLQIIDIGNPESPTLKGSYDTPGQARGVIVSENYAYVADGGGGLQIIDLNLDKLTLSGTPIGVGVFSISIMSSDGTDNVTDTFNINVITYRSAVTVICRNL